jgi:L-alanine-DL-glutamate epimerase-like enolase superfamily enzyme
VDEGCFSSYDVARLARIEACDLVVLKIAKSAGAWGCQRSAIVAEANGLGLRGSGLTEAGIGLAASIHLYSTEELVLPPELLLFGNWRIEAVEQIARAGAGRRDHSREISSPRACGLGTGYRCGRPRRS